MSNSSKPIVFLDTNAVDSSSIATFFGRANELNKIADKVEFALPRVVYDELINHKRRYFENKKSELRRNPLLPLLIKGGVSLNEVSFDEQIEEMNARCSIDFSIVDLSRKKEAFDKIYSLAIRNDAPFDKGSDKGFKDACAACTIVEFADDHPEVDSIFLVSSDSRLKDFFDKDARVKTFLTLEELCEAIAGSEKMREAEASDDKSEQPETSETLDDLVESLCSSPSFSATHRIISVLASMRHDMTNEQELEILEAAANNQQINWILSDHDIRDFIIPVFEKHHELLDEHDYRSIVDAAGLPNNRVDEFGNVTLSRSEREVYSSFADGLISHIQIRELGTRVIDDCQEIESGLRGILAKGEIDNNAVTWRMVAECFITDGSVAVSESPVSIASIKQFLRLLSSSPERKRKAIIESLRARLEEIDEELPF